MVGVRVSKRVLSQGASRATGFGTVRRCRAGRESPALRRCHQTDSKFRVISKFRGVSDLRAQGQVVRRLFRRTRGTLSRSVPVRTVPPRSQILPLQE